MTFWSEQMITHLVAAITAALVISASTTHAQPTVRPLDGRITPVAPAISAIRSGTVIKVIRDGQTVRTLTTEIPVKLPAGILDRGGATPRLSLTDRQGFVVDPDKGEWYLLIDHHNGFDLSVEGDNRLVTSSDACTRPADRNAFLGSTSTLLKTITDREEGPKREVLSVENCIPYRAVLECGEVTGCDKLKKNLPDSFIANLITLKELEIPERIAPRALLQPARDDRLDAQLRPAGTAGEFKYKSPGTTLIRQYAPPQRCVAKGREFPVNRETPYSRLVFAGPDLVKRFPIVLTGEQKAVANSQIFAPGGSFFAEDDGSGRSPKEFKNKEFKKKCPEISYDDTMGSFGHEDEFDDRNFTMPWVDTFCEWRSNAYTQPFCARIGARATRGPHYGVDIRSWNNEMDENVPIVSVSDGVVVEVGTKKHEDGIWEGFVVKIRSQHLIFVYRHMRPDQSPFSQSSPNRIALGDRVAAGQLIGYMGKFLDEPKGTTKHLHFEIEAPVPKAVLLGPACLFQAKVNGEMRTVRVCTAREKAPAYPTLIVSYLAERYGESVELTKIDTLTGLPSLPILPAHEEGAASTARTISR
jgi:murein DD-endopeptidase MepM/ murein hydrolase activator NlpD